MVQVDISRAKATLSDLVARAEAGEPAVLSRAGRPVATIEALSAPTTDQRQLGLWDHLDLAIPADMFIGPDPATAEALG